MFTRSSRALSAAAVLALTTFTAGAAPLPSRQKVTVGEFAVKITRALGYAIDDQEVAGNTLRNAGVHLDADLGAPLTEGRAADIMRDMGMETTVSGDPGNPMSPVAAERAATAVALAAAAASAAEGFSAAPATESCTNVGDRSACFACCSSILSPKTNRPILVFLVCGLICARLFPPPSASSPSR